MQKKTSIMLISIFILINLFFCIKNEELEEILYNENAPWYIEINKINLKENLYLDSITSEDIKGVVLFKEYGRPNVEYSNTIIGAHSGTGENVYFNDIDKLKLGDEIFIYYKNIKYKYVVIDKYEVIETDLTPLNSMKNKTILTLITCNSIDNTKRVIVVSERF